MFKVGILIAVRYCNNTHAIILKYLIGMHPHCNFNGSKNSIDRILYILWHLVPCQFSCGLGIVVVTCNLDMQLRSTTIIRSSVPVRHL